MLMTFLPPLLAFSSWMWLDCIARTSLGMLLEEECLCLWILTLQMGDIPLRCTKRCTARALYCPFGLVVNYLYWGTSGAFCLLLHTVCLFSRFLDERNWFIQDWRIVHMCWWRADGAGCWTPAGRRALWRVERCCCGFTTAPAKCTFSPRHISTSQLSTSKYSTDLINSNYKVGSTNLSSSVRPRSWLRLRLIGYTVGTRVRSLVICLNLSSLLRCDCPG